MFDSNDRDQAEQYLVLLGQTHHPGRIIEGGPYMNNGLYELDFETPIYNIKTNIPLALSLGPHKRETHI